MYDQNKKLVDKREGLRVKIKSLMEEARIIRREEQRTHGELRDWLHRHRVDDVRYEARHAHIAYGLIRGRRYEQMEPVCHNPPDLDKITHLLKKYGPYGIASAEVLMAPPAAEAKAA